MSSGITVGIDIGTTSVKALAVDRDGTIVARARVPHDIHAPSVDVFEHDAKQAWVDGPRKALDELDVAEFDGLTVATMVPSFAAVDADGIPFTPGLLYGDHRGRAGRNEADLLNSREYRSMLEWTAKQAPAAHGYWTAPAVAAAALGGAPAIDYGTAFALAPLWDGVWQADALAEIGITPEQLPRVAGDDEVTGRIRGAANGPGMADAWAEATVAGINSPGDVMVICGTTLIVWCVMPEPAMVPGMWSIPHPLGELSILGGASNAGGMFVNWARRALGGTPAAAASPAGVPIFVPYLKGERTPVHDISLRASVHGLDISHDGASIMRAAYEASAFVARRMIELSGARATRIVASGGGTHDPQWMQALADCTGLPVDLVAVPEGAALGAAWQARVVAGLDAKHDVVRWVKQGEHYEPKVDWAGPCEERYRSWLELASTFKV
ncbi:MAG TPA: FGGY-family carbohydrate kinase [Mycobacteriales bacterium]|nr:FGGY-family carbohydrate kinase [Mycobacteriales bacterium]